MFNGEREVPGRRKVVRGSNVSVLTSHVGQNPRSKSGYEPERRVINGDREVPDRQKAVRGSNVSVLTSHVGQNPRSCTALSLIDGRGTRPRLVHASIARGITASLVSLCEAWVRAGTANYQHKRFVIVSGLLFCVMIPRATLACQRQKPLDYLQTDGKQV